MKKVLISMAAAAAALCTISCNKDNVASDVMPEMPEVAGERSELTVSLGKTALTKATEASKGDEVTVNSLQVFVFRGDALDAYINVSASTATLSCTSGAREVYAVVNAPSLAAYNTKTTLLAATSDLANNVYTDSDTEKLGFVMIGKTDVTLPQTEAVNIDVNRLVSRVTLKKITRNFTSTALQTASFNVDKVYLINVAGDINYGLTEDPTTWYNEAKHESKLATLTYTAPDQSISNTESYTTPTYLYCYPNSGESTPTRLVVEATIGTSKYYYPITLPALESNKTYEISELIITRPGSDDPNVPVSFSDCTFEITVQPWTVVPVADSEENDYIKI